MILLDPIKAIEVILDQKKEIKSQKNYL